MNSDRLERWVKSGILDPIDLSLAREISRLAELETDGTLMWIVALLSHATFGQRHICLSEATLRRPSDLLSDLLPEERAVLRTLPPLSWEELPASVTGRPGDSEKPLIRETDRLYFQRFWKYERDLASKLVAFRDQPPFPRPNADEIRPLHAYFTKNTRDPDPQIEAVRMVCGETFSVITGGPGTGKTTIVSVILARLYQENPSLKIALCAPTGKAQSRLSESLRAEAEHLCAASETRRKVAETPTSTIHRLLRWQGGGFGEPQLLNFDWVIIDEVSMVSIDLLNALFARFSPHTRVVLLGDKDQLASVENGTILADICEAAAIPGSPWTRRVIRLEKSHRFKEESGIRRLKEAVNAGNRRTFFDLLAGESDLAWHLPPREAGAFNGVMASLLKSMPEFMQGPWLMDYPDVKSAFEAAGCFQILCASRKGLGGVESLSYLIRQMLKKEDLPYFKGLPVMVTCNDYGIKLFNGDVGLCWPDEAGQLAVWFPEADTGGFRRIPFSRLPRHEAAFAMTVHKSQGSGFGRILLVLPSNDTPLLTRELLYTGITRAKQRCDLWGSAAVLRLAVTRITRRASGLPEKIR